MELSNCSFVLRLKVTSYFIVICYLSAFCRFFGKNVNYEYHYRVTNNARKIIIAYISKNLMIPPILITGYEQSKLYLHRLDYRQ